MALARATSLTAAFLTAAFLTAAFLLAAMPAAAGEPSATQLAGRFGYTGEWEFSAVLAPREARGRGEAGTYSLRHTAQCMPGEVAEKAGAITLARAPVGGRASARITLDGEECLFAGPLSETRHGLLACPGKPDVPMRLWVRP